MAELCFITTCKGRLDHLQRSLPVRIGQPGTTNVVVDYDCPDGAAAWAATHHPPAQVVKIENRPFFNAAEARNLGAASPAARAADWLCFVDADVVLDAGFSRDVIPLLRPGHFHVPKVDRFDATGLCIVSREDFDRVDGYDTVFRGYGVEDEDLYVRLGMRGIAARNFPGETLRAIVRHDGQRRTAFHERKDLNLNVTVNFAYARAKWDLMRLKGEDMPLAPRQQLYDYVLECFQRHGTSREPLRLRVALGKFATRTHGTAESALVYEFGMQPVSASPPASP